MEEITNKRQRTAADTGVHINELPIGLMVDVSAYLAKSSRALLAVAFSAPSSSWRSNDLIHLPLPITTAIISASQWDTLDFEDIERELANKLTDDDINAVLKSVHAQDVLKRLKLCGCINITGHGLNLLQASVVLEQIDISLAEKNDYQYIEPEPKISEEVVMPILDSIISADGCSLKHIQFPSMFRRESRVYTVLEFQTRYNIQFLSREISCAKCNEAAPDTYRMNDYLIINKTCYDCLAPLCGDCRRDDENGGFSLKWCNACDKTYCTDCVTVSKCAYCSDKRCEGCAMKACDECGNANCENCLYTCDCCKMTRCIDCSPDEYHHCGNCSNQNCEDCYNGKEYSVKYCEECDSENCNDCRLKNVKQHGVEGCCSVCTVDLIPLLLQQQAKLAKEVEGLTKDNQELREKVESMSLSW